MSTEADITGWLLYGIGAAIVIGWLIWVLTKGDR